MGKIFADFDVEQQETARLRRRQNSIRNAMQNCWLSIRAEVIRYLSLAPEGLSPSSPAFQGRV